MKTTYLLTLTAASILATAGSAQAAVVIPTDAAAWDRGSGAANGTGNGGLLQTTTLTIDLSQPDLNDPSTWTTTTESWPSDFQGQDVDSLSGNPWIVYDLGASYDLINAYIITNVEANRGFKDIQIWYSNDISSNAVTTWASLGALTDGAGNVVDYDFTAGGWTQIGGTFTLLDVNNAHGTQAQPATELDISGITSARYIGILGLNTFNDDGGANPFGTGTGLRAGINQIAFTAVPEPSALLLGGLGILALFRRRRA